MSESHWKGATLECVWPAHGGKRPGADGEKAGSATRGASGIPRLRMS